MAIRLSRRKLKPKEHEDAGELNIIPYLDILMNLVLFMLLSMTGLAAFGIVNITAPTYGGGPGAGAPDAGPQLMLTVAISKKGFFISSANVVVGSAAPTNPGEAAPTIPLKPDGTYDFEQLGQSMVQIKSAHPYERTVQLAADREVPYQVLVETMDSVRESTGRDRRELFPEVILAEF